METHSSILAWEIPWVEEPGGLQSKLSWKSRTWLMWLSTHPEFYHRLWLKPWEGNGKKKKKSGWGLLRRKRLEIMQSVVGLGLWEESMWGEIWRGGSDPIIEESAQGPEAGAVQPLDRVTVGGEEGYTSPKVLYPSANLSFSLPPVFSIFSCQPDSINIKTEVLNVFKSTSLL